MPVDDLPPIRPHRGEPLRCPACSARLVEVERSDVLIDACPECRGVWLDRGELDRILVKERRAVAADEDDDFLAEVEGRRRAGPGRGRDVPARDGRREAPRRRKRGILEDLFDFEL